MKMSKNNIINAILLSLPLKQCKNIASGKQSIIVRKTRPKIETPFKCYIYCTKSMKHLYKFSENIDCTYIERYYTTDHNKYSLVPQGYINGKVIGEFVCDGIISHCEIGNADIAEQQGRIKREDLIRYACGKELYGWHISDLVIYDEPKELNEFYVEDTVSIKKCKYRFRTGQPEDVAKHGGWIKGSYVCMKSGEPEWCENCITKTLTRPPQSWYYVRR